MSRNPFVPAKDQSTEFGFGQGHFPEPSIDYSINGIKSGIPVADPDRRQQYLDLFAARRTDLNDPTVPEAPSFSGTSPTTFRDYYTDGNTERYGANPPLVQERKRPPPKKRKFVPLNHMQRQP